MVAPFPEFPETHFYSPDSRFVHDFEKIIQYTVYKNPVDARGKYVIRQWTAEQERGIKSGKGFVCDTLDEARSLVPDGLVCLGRQPDDDPNILEVWI